MAIYLAKMAVHHENFSTKNVSLIGASSIYVALKICEQMRQKPILTKDILNELLQVLGDTEESVLIEVSKKLLYLAQNFEKELPGLENLKTAYIPELNKFVQWKFWIQGANHELVGLFLFNCKILLHEGELRIANS